MSTALGSVGTPDADTHSLAKEPRADSQRLPLEPPLRQRQDQLFDGCVKLLKFRVSAWLWRSKLDLFD